MLWGRAAGRCSLPECRVDLYEDETETDDPTLVGENCHIVAESDNGPRSDASVPIAQRNSYGNLILLCRNHHKVIDTQEGEYTVERLLEMKANHEAWVKEQLGFDEGKQLDDEQYAEIVDYWEKHVSTSEWTAWSSWVLSGGQPSISMEQDQNLKVLRQWLLSRVWPERYAELKFAFENFRRILNDFQEKMHKHSVERGVVLVTNKFYQIDEWNEELYSRLLRDYVFHVELVEDLMLELTRAANLICDRVRENLRSNYRLTEGHLVVQLGYTQIFTTTNFIARYSPEERSKKYPYPGLNAFLTERQGRDFHFGGGVDP